MKGGRYGLFVGITAYENYGILPGAEPDAALLADAFREKYGFITRVVPVEAGAGEPKPVSSDLLRSCVVNFKKEIGKANLALIYIAAHGLSDIQKKSYIISSTSSPLEIGGAEAKDLEHLFYPAELLLDCLNSCHGYRLLILDCCRTSPLKRADDLSLFNPGVVVPKALKKGIIVHSTQYDAAAHEKQGRGLFASVLTEEIRSGRHRKAINLFEAVQTRLEEKAPDDVATRDFSVKQYVTIEGGSRHLEILLADESERFARTRTDQIALAGNITSLSSSGSERMIAVATNRAWKSIKAHSEAAPAGRVSAADPTLRFYRHEEEDWRKVNEAELPKKAFAIALTKDALSCFAGYEDGRIIKWSLGEAVFPRPFFARHKKAVNALVLSPDQSFVLSVGRDRKARLHEAMGRECVAVFEHGAEVWAADIAPDNRHFVTGTFKGEMVVWRANRPEEPVAAMSFGDGIGVRALCYANSGFVIAAGLTDGTVRLVRFHEAAGVIEEKERLALKLQLFDPNDGRIWVQARHRDPPVVPASGRGLHVKTQNTKLLEEKTHVLALAFDPEDKTLAVGTDLMGLHFIDLASHRQFVPRGVSEKTFGRTTRVPAVKFSADGRTLFVGNGRLVHVLGFEE